MADDPIGDIPEPRANPLLIGHARAERELLAAFHSGRMAHAWLICGPRGIGKATLAFRMARHVLRHGSEGGDGGGLFGPPEPPTSLYVAPEDPVFRRIAARGHADLLTLERAVNDKTGKLRGEIVVEDVRAAQPFFTRTAAEGGWRVIVVDAADEMNRNAANALLKILEEPPSRALLLLVAHNPGRLLPTIRSRCRRLTLQPLGQAEMGEALARYLPDVRADDARDLIGLAEGSIGRAVSLGEEGAVALFRSMSGLLAGLPDLDVAALHKLGDAVARQGAEGPFDVLCDMLRWWLAGLIRDGAAGGGTADSLAGRLIGRRGLDPWLQVWEKIDDLLGRAAGLDLDRKQVILGVFLALEQAARR